MTQTLAFAPSRRAVLAGLGALVAAPAYAASSPLNIVSTTGMIADLVRSIGGDQVAVTGLMGAGVDPHAYRQTRSDIVAMTRADAVMWHGLYLEAQMEDFLLDLGSRQPVYAIAETVNSDLLVAHEDYEGRFDPHIWMDPDLWVQCVPAVIDALVELRPDARPQFDANAAAFQEEAQALATYARDLLTSVPAERRVLLTAHDAFGYFGTAYDFEVMGIQGISTESEAGLNRIRTLVDFLVERQLPAVFVETSVSDRNIRALVEGAAAQGHEVRIGGSLFSDAMGPDGTYEGTWLGMIDHNVTTIARALGVDTPAGGRLGKLRAAA
ncbi:zinc ABC transporter substrate-binding protein [Tateyamaria omphalii]|uniref:metal ABC transporter solute-binding protein, Zn/Mn family n=1 Tax=Tateyamaria omphalii TaxID=299262 RepID=UPI001C997567|nr:zinc ABC transporter substrate-binding protein [Tateyamaria omphalii]MBY5933188.1 zinc ABC transporter substrate-binding protein [Tateyamaria omphalii]